MRKYLLLLSFLLVFIEVNAQVSKTIYTHKCLTISVTDNLLSIKGKLKEDTLYILQIHDNKGDELLNTNFIFHQPQCNMLLGKALQPGVYRFRVLNKRDKKLVYAGKLKL